MGKRKADCTEEEWKRELERKRLSYIKNNTREKRYGKEKQALPSCSKEERARYLLSSYVRKDKKYGRETNITQQWIIDNVFSGQHCWYCGEWNWRKLGVDRVNPKIGHTIDNCTPCCKRCNDIKGTKTIGELINDSVGKLYLERNKKIANTLSKSVLQLDSEGNVIKEWKSATEAARELGISQGGICMCYQGIRKTSGGYKWKLV